MSFEVPPAASDPTVLADWLELGAAASPRPIRSQQDLIAALGRAGSIDGVPFPEGIDDEPLDEMVEQEDEKLEPIAEAAFDLLAWREGYLGERYPFSIDSVLRARADAQASPYLFLTALTYFGPTHKPAPESGASLFERISRTALVEYLGGLERVHSYDFGFPRRGGSKAFREALNDLCQAMGEGLGCKVSRPKTARVKDAKLDLVAWVPFGDGRRNQISVFGQCAAGMDWRAKLDELQPVDFCNVWLTENPAMAPLLAFFVPRQVEEDRWFEICVGERRIFFDRLRIARYLGALDAELAQDCAAWTASAMSGDEDASAVAASGGATS
ncbi:MAG: hypothetical protein F4X03_12920 [Dehalococcoidia bacterium]|nr:hypothetical protein [Dehalococcoidia bacterium]